MTNFASLGITVETSGVAKGSAELDKLAGAAGRAESAAGGIGPAYKEAAAAVQTSAQASQRAAGAYTQHSERVQAATLSVKQYSQALRLLPAQVTDIVTGLASGQSAFIVAIQQGGQLRDSFGGFGNALRAVGTLITPLRLAIGASAGAAGLLAKAFYDAQAEGFNLSKAIALSGNSAGISASRVRELAISVDELVGTQASASETLAQLISSGRVSADNLQQFAVVAQNLQRTAGQSIADTVKIFTELGRKPVDASLKLNETVNFLTESTYKQIKALEDAGRTFDAGELAQQAYAKAMSERARKLDEELGTLQRAARGTGEVFASMWDAVLNIGRPDTLKQQIDAATEQLRQLDSYLARLPGSARATNPNVDTDRAELAERLQGLRALQKAQDDAAKSDAARKQGLDRFVASEKESIKVGDARRALLEETARQQLAGDVSALRRSLDVSLSGYSAYTAQLEALRSADLVSDQEYYGAKRALIERDAQLRERALRTENARITSELRRLTNARSDAGRAALDAPGGRTDRIKAETPFNREILQQQERMKQNEAELTQLRIQSAAALGTVTVEQRAAGNAQVRALTDMRTAAEAYLQTLERANDRRLDTFGLGGRAREIAESRNDVDDRFAEQRRDLDNERARLQAEGKFTQQAQRLYDERLAIINEFNQKALAATDRYYTELGEKESSFFQGARQAYSNFLDSTRNVAQQTEQLFTRTFDGMTDALVDFARTGKLDFKSLANSIIADLLRIQIQAAAVQIFGSLAGAFAGGGAIGGTGAGGGAAPSSGGVLYADVGIRRVPRDNQLAVLHKDEAVIPASMNPFMGGGSARSGPSVSIGPTYISGQGLSLAQIDALVQQRNDELEAKIADNIHSNRWAEVMSTS